MRLNDVYLNGENNFLFSLEESLMILSPEAHDVYSYENRAEGKVQTTNYICFFMHRPDKALC